MNPNTVVSMPAHAEPAPAATRPLPQPAVQAAQQPQRPYSAFAPLVLGCLALLLGLGWQTWLLAQDRATLQAAHAGQQQTVDNAGKLRASLDALAADTQRLADTGNASAGLLVAELRKRGITIDPKATQAAPPAPATAKP
jgi:uncharacterized protein HemX